MKIPEDIYERILDLATSLTNASEAGDTKFYWNLYGELRKFCEGESESGRDHPFLWETLADFTSDDRAAITLYAKALASANDPAAAGDRASIQLAMAERYRDLGDPALARKFAVAANEEAKALDDLELRRSISEFLLSASEHITTER